MRNGVNKRKDLEQDDSPRNSKVHKPEENRQDGIMKEFTEAYLSLTTLYKTLEEEQLKSRLYLPRTLSYRQQITRKKTKNLTKSSNAQIKAEYEVCLRELKLSMTSETMEMMKNILKTNKRRIGVSVSIYSSHQSMEMKEKNLQQIQLLASSMIHIPFEHEIIFSTQLFQNSKKNTPLNECIVVFQIVCLQNDFTTNSNIELKRNTKERWVPYDTLAQTNAMECQPYFGTSIVLDCKNPHGREYSIELPSLNDTNQQDKVKMSFSLHRRLRIQNPLKKERIKRIIQMKFNKESTQLPSQGNDNTVVNVLDIPKRNTTWTLEAVKPSHVWFHYMFHLNLRRISEKRPNLSCPWCNLYAGTLQGLVAHLVCSHDRCKFQVVIDHDNSPHIHVSINTEKYPVDEDWNMETGQPITKLSTKSYYYHASKQSKDRVFSDYDSLSVECMKEFDEIDETTYEPKETDSYLLHGRQYFHSRTGAVVLPNERDYDSDDDVDEEWIIKQSEQMLDEFEDVAIEEKEFMKKWNRHVKEYKILADFIVASSCRLFAKLHGKWLLERGLRHNFLLHLFNLWDNSLLNSRAIVDCMLIVDHYKLEDTTENSTSVESIKSK